MRIPTWKERLKSCFRWRHRLMHVFGAPAALGAVTSVATASMLNADVGLSLGLLTAGIGTLLAGYYVTAGFDQKVVAQLQQEEEQQEQAKEVQELHAAVQLADPAVRPALERIFYYYATIEAVFTDETVDTVEAVLESSRDDLRALRDRAAALASLYQRLQVIISQSDGRWLYSEIQRMEHELSQLPAGPVKETMATAKESTERTLTQWNLAHNKQQQIRSMLTMIESNLHEFKLAMELRKADAALGAHTTQVGVQELQERLVAAGQACDELVGGKQTRRRRYA